MSYVAVGAVDPSEEEPMVGGDEAEDDVPDDRSALDKTIDRIGMGYYQWSLLALCGFGWMADNMWLQGIAVILPRVQDHFHISDRSIGILSASMFFGMMIGAVGWGTCADVMGRRTAFQFTLFFASMFGLLSPFMPNFGSLCLCFFFLGSAVGGSMPTDGTLFIENVPLNKQYLLTALSVFFSIGAVLSSILGAVIIPGHSCPETSERECDVRTENLGWKYVLGVLGIFTLLMCLARIVLFRMRESPRYLVSAGRPAEAVHSLRRILSYNGHKLSLTLDDVVDEPPDKEVAERPASLAVPGFAQEGSNVDYRSTHSSPEPILANTYAYDTPAVEIPEPTYSPPQPVHRSAIVEVRSPLRRIPLIGPPIGSWLDRMSRLLVPEWRRTTLFMWAVWALVALAYTMFNVFLPKLLETRAGQVGGGGRKEALRNYLLYTFAGTPGALLGAFMIETRLGRKGSLVLSTIFTAVCTLAFVIAESEWALVSVTMAISLGATTMWAVLYGMTPEIFTTEVRASATGMASALSRIAGMVAPILGGMFLAISPSVPIFASAAVSFVAAACASALPRDKPRERNSRPAAVH